MTNERQRRGQRRCRPGRRPCRRSVGIDSEADGGGVTAPARRRRAPGRSPAATTSPRRSGLRRGGCRSGRRRADRRRGQHAVQHGSGQVGPGHVHAREIDRSLDGVDRPQARPAQPGAGQIDVEQRGPVETSPRQVGVAQVHRADRRARRSAAARHAPCRSTSTPSPLADRHRRGRSPPGRPYRVPRPDPDRGRPPARTIAPSAPARGATRCVRSYRPDGHGRRVVHIDVVVTVVVSSRPADGSCRAGCSAA